ncbi:MAG: ATP-binding cassette domain-containing protein [Pseudomonadota bacterium]
MTIPEAQRPGAPAVPADSLRPLLYRLLAGARSAAVDELVRLPPGTPRAALVAFAVRRTPLKLARVDGYSELAARGERAVCLGEPGRSVLVEPVGANACRIEMESWGAAREVRPAVLRSLFPCRVLYLEGAAATTRPTSGGVGAPALSVYLRLCSQLLALAMPVAMLLVIDKVVSQGAGNTLAVLVVGVALLTAFQYLFGAAATLHGAREVEAGARERRRAVLAAVLRCSRPGSASGWEAMQASSELARYPAETRVQGLTDALFVVSLALLMLAFSPLLLGVALAFVPLYLAVSAWSEQASARLAARGAGKRDALAAAFLDWTSAPELVQSLDLANRLESRWQARDDALTGDRYRLLLWQRLPAQGIELLQRLSLVVIMLLGVSHVISGVMTLGQFIAFNLLAMQLAPPLLRLAALWRARAEHRRLLAARRQLLATCREGAWPEAGTRQFPQHQRVLLDVSGVALATGEAANFAVAGGTWLGLSGPSGCGKSTLLRTIAGLRQGGGGAVRVNGIEVTRYRRDSLTRGLRLVAQEPAAFADTVAGNLWLGDPAAPPERVLEVARVCGLEPVFAGTPEHLNTPVGSGGRALSGGERQRLALARAIIARPRVLLLDEATSALDAAGEARLLTRLRAYLPDTAVLVVSHRDATLARCDRVVRLAADGAAGR